MTVVPRLGIHSRPSSPSRGMVPQRRTERACSGAAWCSAQTVLGRHGLQTSATELAVLAFAIHLHV